MDAEDFAIRFPEFSSETEERIDLFIEQAKRQVDESVWGKLYPDGLAYLTAHLLKSSPSSGGSAAGPVLQSKVGDLSRTYGDMTTSLGSLGTTSYGIEYARMRRLLVTGPGITC